MEIEDRNIPIPVNRKAEQEVLKQAEVVLTPIEDMEGPDHRREKVLVVVGRQVEEWIVDSEEGVIPPSHPPQKTSD